MDNELLAPDQARDESWKHTRQAYEENPRLLRKASVKALAGSLKNVCDNALRYVAADAHILELGSGFGETADYLESLKQGYNVRRTDPVRNFVRSQKAQRKKAHHFDIVTDVYKVQFDMVIAPAMFHHFDDEDFEAASGHVMKMLPSYGIFAIGGYSGVGACFKPYGTHQRYFCYRTPQMLANSLKRSGFIVEEYYLLGGTWANCIASKP